MAAAMPFIAKPTILPAQVTYHIPPQPSVVLPQWEELHEVSPKPAERYEAFGIMNNAQQGL
eukprot:2258978-Amphidinium_carterae.1